MVTRATAPRRSSSYVPPRGDTIWLVFDPQSGHEQKGRRPALVLSPREYNERVGLALVCPITSQVKGYPFEVTITGSGAVHGVILADQVRSLDWRTRKAKRIATVPAATLEAVIGRVELLLRG